MSVKRKRGNGLAGQSLPRKKLKRGSAPPANSRSLANVESLRWRPVKLPESLDDAEGFFGLEEIDDVEVTGDIAAGKAVFTDLQGDAREQVPGEELEEEWGGLEDDRGMSEGLEEEAETNGAGDQSPEGANSTAEEAADRLSDPESSESSSEEEGFRPLRHPIDEPLDADDSVPPLPGWSSVQLTDTTIQSLRRLKFQNPTPIQELSIPPILQGRDVVGKAVTGSGKTLAYAIPIWQAIQSEKRYKKAKSSEYPLASLILAPTRELAHQIGSHITALCGKSVRLAVVTGGLSVQKQVRLLKHAQIVIGTPGRLWEMLDASQEFAEAARTRMGFLVVDEADRLLADGHYEELGKIMDILNKKPATNEAAYTDGQDEASDSGSNSDSSPSESLTASDRQTLVFSATLSKALQRRLNSNKPLTSHSSTAGTPQTDMAYLLSKLSFRDEKPLFIDANPDSQLATRLREGILECAANEKDLYLYSVLLLHPAAKTLIFTNSISAVRRIASTLQLLNLPSVALHSQMTQQARMKAIERFRGVESRSGKTSTAAGILVATDVAARGLDIPSVAMVVHYHAPRAADLYIHRSGRTARSNAAGTSVLLCSPDESAAVRRLVRTVHGEGSAAVKTFDIDRRLPTRLGTRLSLARKITDVEQSNEKVSAEDRFLAKAAEELGAEYDAAEFAAQAARYGGRGRGKNKSKVLRGEEEKGREKERVRGWRAELRGLLGERVNLGVSERYITRGGIDIEGLVESRGGEFLGTVEGMRFVEN